MIEAGVATLAMCGGGRRRRTCVEVLPCAVAAVVRGGEACVYTGQRLQLHIRVNQRAEKRLEETGRCSRIGRSQLL